ncbi:MAG: hypothetical protein IT242_05965 [Bacteroidia bacterium]|nr:hypothetical protein [Bacteroidia bacterium]
MHNLEPEDIISIVNLELEDKDAFTFPALFQDGLDEIRTDPVRAVFFNPETRLQETHWIVADEIPGDDVNGRFIIYSEEDNLFGIAGKTGPGEGESGSITGFYGSLADALDNLSDEINP